METRLWKYFTLLLRTVVKLLLVGPFPFSVTVPVRRPPRVAQYPLPFLEKHEPRLTRSRQAPVLQPNFLRSETSDTTCEH